MTLKCNIFVHCAVITSESWQLLVGRAGPAALDEQTAFLKTGKVTIQRGDVVSIVISYILYIIFLFLSVPYFGFCLLFPYASLDSYLGCTDYHHHHHPVEWTFSFWVLICSRGWNFAMLPLVHRCSQFTNEIFEKAILIVCAFLVDDQGFPQGFGIRK